MREIIEIQAGFENFSWCVLNYVLDDVQEITCISSEQITNLTNHNRYTERYTHSLSLETVHF